MRFEPGTVVRSHDPNFEGLWLVVLVDGGGWAHGVHLKTEKDPSRLSHVDVENFAVPLPAACTYHGEIKHAVLDNIVRMVNNAARREHNAALEVVGERNPTGWLCKHPSKSRLMYVRTVFDDGSEVLPVRRPTGHRTDLPLEPYLDVNAGASLHGALRDMVIDTNERFVVRNGALAQSLMWTELGETGTRALQNMFEKTGRYHRPKVGDLVRAWVLLRTGSGWYSLKNRPVVVLDTELVAGRTELLVGWSSTKDHTPGVDVKIGTKESANSKFHTVHVRGIGRLLQVNVTGRLGTVDDGCVDQIIQYYRTDGDHSPTDLDYWWQHLTALDPLLLPATGQP